jgi:acetyl esterase
MLKLDDRMTDETKSVAEIVLNAYREVKNVQLFRQKQDLIDKEANEKARFDGLDYAESFVKSETDDYQIPVTMYLPKNRTPSTAIVVFFHGGGFSVLTRQTYQRPIAHIAQATSTIWISVEYRLAPEFKHPRGIRDCTSVAKWALEQKNNLFGSNENAKVGVAGDSAGGNLAVNVAYELRNKVSFQILIYPWLDMTCSSDSYREFTAPCFALEPDLFQYMICDYLEDQRDASLVTASPLFQTDHNGVAQALIINAELDPIFDDGHKYSQKLRQANIKCEFRMIKGVLHAFFDAYDLYKNAFDECVNLIVDYFNREISI